MKANQAKYRQMTMFNELSRLEEREINWLIHSWAFPFRIFVYSMIKPEMFDCLYSVIDSRPSNPPQVVMSLLIIQAMFDYTDDRMHDWMMSKAVDIRFATNTLGLPADQLPTSDKMLSRFRERDREYARTHDGHSPIMECIQSVSYGLAALMGLGLDNVRIDSTMVAANMKRMNRSMLLYTVNRRMVLRLVHTHEKEEIKKALDEHKLSHYLEASDINVVLYHTKTSFDEKNKGLLADADSILELCTEEDLKSEQGTMFTRVLSEQTIVDEDGKRRLATSEDHVMTSKNVQNPADPDATYRQKAGKEFIGYIVNLAESVGPFGSLVLSWDFEQNIASDAVMSYQFLKDAENIMDGINSWRSEYGISEDTDMQKCRELLNKKMDQVADVIRKAIREKTPIPRSISNDFRMEPEKEDDTSSDYQMTLDDLLSSMSLPMYEEEKPDENSRDLSDPDLSSEINAFLPQPDQAKEETVVGIESKQTDAPETSDAEKVEEEWTVLGKPGPEGIKLPEFADLDAQERRKALLKMVSLRHPWQLKSTSETHYAVTDGAYAIDELIATAAQNGFTLAPTDLLGKDTNPIIGLFTLNDDRTRVTACPGENTILSQREVRGGKIELRMDASGCANCPFKNDCKGRMLKRKPETVVRISPNAQARVITEANLGTENYKMIGRFRNGVETIPAFLHNVLNIDHLPIGREIKEAAINLRLMALNVRKFDLFLFGRTQYAPNPIYDR